MPRKSTKLRIQQGQEMMARYELAGINNIWPAQKAYNFVNDMTTRLIAGRGWSKRQREYFDACVDAPTPVIQSADEDLEAKLRAAFKVLGRDGAICVEFAQRLRGGKNLTEKQMAWAQKCLDLADKISSGSEWIPDEQQVARMRLVLSLKSCYSNTFWSTHPAQYRSLETLGAYLSGDKAFITEEDVKRAEFAVRGSLRKIDTPRFQLGSHGWLNHQSRTYNDDGELETRKTKHFVLICSEPYPNNGDICYDVLINGESKTLCGDRIAKR